MAETTYYIVGEKLELKDGFIEPSETSFTGDLSELYENNGKLLASTLEEWTRKVVASEDIQLALGIQLRVATKEDLAGREDELEIFDAFRQVASARERAEREELEGKTKVVHYFSDTITTEKEATAFLKNYRTSANRMSFFIEQVASAEAKSQTGWKFSPVAAKALANAWTATAGTDSTKKAKLMDGPRYKLVQTWSK
ncbi:hypothetical protein ACUWEX_11140 [Okibacterium fritillariae]|uniref:hypothetical protein n=1 Tax=Okibacterium fritillariae TaxID=123320 RepID=UPI004055939B